jgi:hypothetical protein
MTWGKFSSNTACEPFTEQVLFSKMIAVCPAGELCAPPSFAVAIRHWTSTFVQMLSAMTMS